MSEVSNTHIIREVLCLMAWYRAKGELMGLLQTFYGSPHFYLAEPGTYDTTHPLHIEHDKFDKLSALIHAFIDEAEEILA